jgi:hypothetical protein
MTWGVVVVVAAVVYYTVKEVSCGEYSMYNNMCPGGTMTSMVNAFNFDKGKMSMFAGGCAPKRDHLRKCLSDYFTGLDPNDRASLPQNIQSAYFGSRATTERQSDDQYRGKSQGKSLDPAQVDDDSSGAQSSTSKSVPEADTAN